MRNNMVYVTKRRRRRKGNHLVQWRDAMSTDCGTGGLAGTPRSRVLGAVTRIWTRTQCSGCYGRLHRGESGFCFRSTPVTMMAPEASVAESHSASSSASLMCRYHVCVTGEHEQAVEEFSMWKGESWVHTAAEKVRNPPAGPPWQPRPWGHWGPTSPSGGFLKETTGQSWER